MRAHSNSSLSPTSHYFGLDSAGTPDVESFHFYDAQEQASALTGWNQDYLQLSAGGFHGEISQLQGTGIRLFVEQVQQSVFQTGLLANDILAIGIPLDTAGTGVFCGTTCGADSFHVFSGSNGFEFRSARQHTMLGVELQVGKNWMNTSHSATVDPFSWSTRDLPAQACTLTLGRAAQTEVRAYLLSLFRAAKLNPCLLSTPAVMSIVADYLLDRMSQVDQAHDSAADICTHWNLVQKACDIANDHWDETPTVAQLCLDLGVSRRTLQNGFQKVLDVSPLTYLKAVRLGQARRILKGASSVTEAATACGFWHFGHFSQDYQAMFGERPSDTLRDAGRA
jgi:AraC family ethanolamine operon transcriptional activator